MLEKAALIAELSAIGFLWALAIVYGLRRGRMRCSAPASQNELVPLKPERLPVTQRGGAIAVTQLAPLAVPASAQTAVLMSQPAARISPDTAPSLTPRRLTATAELDRIQAILDRSIAGADTMARAQADATTQVDAAEHAFDQLISDLKSVRAIRTKDAA